MNPDDEINETLLMTRCFILRLEATAFLHARVLPVDRSPFWDCLIPLAKYLQEKEENQK